MVNKPKRSQGIIRHRGTSLDLDLPCSVVEVYCHATFFLIISVVESEEQDSFYIRMDIINLTSDIIAVNPDPRSYKIGPNLKVIKRGDSNQGIEARTTLDGNTLLIWAHSD